MAIDPAPASLTQTAACCYPEPYLPPPVQSRLVRCLAPNHIRGMTLTQFPSLWLEVMAMSPDVHHVRSDAVRVLLSASKTRVNHACRARRKWREEGLVKSPPEVCGHAAILYKTAVRRWGRSKQLAWGRELSSFLELPSEYKGWPTSLSLESDETKIYSSNINISPMLLYGDTRADLRCGSLFVLLSRRVLEVYDTCIFVFN